MDSEPASTETPVCTETVPIPASADTSPTFQPATDEEDEEDVPTGEVSQAEDDPDEQNDSTYLPSV
jgi:hypothetical protein